jgi:hypothetical protein
MTHQCPRTGHNMRIHRVHGKVIKVLINQKPKVEGGRELPNGEYKVFEILPEGTAANWCVAIYWIYIRLKMLPVNFPRFAR